MDTLNIILDIQEMEYLSQKINRRLLNEFETFKLN